MESEQRVNEEVRKIYLRNESKDLKEQFKTLRDIAIKANPYDKCVIEYIEEEFYRNVEILIEKASKLN
ncbi:MAG: hypothetical protein AB6733_21140 [Clostridiaceae bacterium]